MIGVAGDLHDCLPCDNWLESAAIRVWVVLLAAVAILSSAFHFWPLENSRVWAVLCLPNTLAGLWGATLLILGIYKRRWPPLSWRLPHVSVFAFLLVTVLSTAFALKQGRAISFTAKLILMFVCGHVLFCSAVFSWPSLRLVYRLAVLATVISVVCTLSFRYFCETEDFGFHRSPHKYGTFVSILVILAGSYLLQSPQLAKRVTAVGLIWGTFLSVGTVGSLLALVVGMAVSLVVIRQPMGKLLALAGVAAAPVIIMIASSGGFIAPLAADLPLRESDQKDIKQRYIEWQAEINLLEKRAAMGTGAGCINEHRSEFYYRLPKRNTLQPYDQNGWLATAAETGVLGLLCFSWIIVHYGGEALRQLIRMADKYGNEYRCAAANVAALATALTANVFSSLNYNGVLIAFVLVLSLIASTQATFRERPQ